MSFHACILFIMDEITLAVDIDIFRKCFHLLLMANANSILLNYKVLDLSVAFVEFLPMTKLNIFHFLKGFSLSCIKPSFSQTNALK